MLKLVLVTILFLGGYCLDEAVDYYWKDYFGAIPEDALVAGRSIGRSKVYIGQAYLRNWGLFAVQINPEVKEVYIPQNGIHKVDKNIKIFCGPKENFYWLKVNGSALHLSLADKHAVTGGYEDEKGYMHIGRISLGGNTVVGKVNSFELEKTVFAYHANGEEKQLHTFEILIYNPPDPGILL